MPNTANATKPNDNQNACNGLAQLANLYALNDAERFPASQMAEGLERASTLYFADFMVAVPFGMRAVKDTFERTHYKSIGYKMLTELVCVLNHLGWYFYGKAEAERKGGLETAAKRSDEFAQYFFARYKEVDCWAGEHLQGDEAQFYYAVLD